MTALIPLPEVEAAAIEDLDVAGAAATPWRRVGHRFRRNRVAMAGLTFICLVVVAAAAAPLIAPYGPSTQDLNLINHGPMASHLLGTDYVGRDILSRVIFGARVSMQVSILVVGFALTAALPLGLVAGYVGRWVDAVIMRVMDALFTFPPLMLALAVAAFLGHNIITTATAISIVFVPGFVRIIRAQVLSVREETYIEASRSVGITEVRMLWRHVLPNVSTPLTVQVALSFGYALLAEAGLSFLNFGVQPPTPSWGVMLEQAYNFITSKPWPLIPPGMAILLTVLAFNLVGDGLRDALGREASVAMR
jgi:peptide/nickel transport system permease protein